MARIQKKKNRRASKKKRRAFFDRPFVRTVCQGKKLSICKRGYVYNVSCVLFDVRAFVGACELPCSRIYKGKRLIVLFANDKGGVGKTTLAVNMAVMRMLMGRDVVLADCDPQRTATNWCSLRAAAGDVQTFQRVQLTGSDVAQELVKLSARCDDLIVDTHGADSVEMRQAMTVADKVIMPLQMSQFDLWGVGRVKEVVKTIEAAWPEGQRVDLRAIINCAHPQSKRDKVAMREALEAGGVAVLETVMHWRLIYQRLAGMGRAVVEMRSMDDRRKALAEMLHAYFEIFGEHYDYESIHEAA